MRTAIYARFSTELQQERSIEDQFELCRAYAAKNGLDVVGTYDDRARSGASIFGRDGLMRMMDAARDGTFDVILVESLDRKTHVHDDVLSNGRIGDVLQTDVLLDAAEIDERHQGAVTVGQTQDLSRNR